MQTKPNALAAALLNIATAKTATTAAAMAQPEEKAANAVLTAVEANFSDRQIDAIFEFTGLALEHASMRVTLAGMVAEIFPKFPNWEAYKAAGMAIESLGGDYCRKVYRRAVEDHFGKLPTAGKARKGNGKSGLTAARWIRTVDTGIANLLARVENVPKEDVNAAVLREFMVAIRQVQSMAKVLRKAVNE